jgi:undecaprenyl-diphosphatase
LLEVPMDEGILLGINQGWAHPLLDALFGWVSQKNTFSFPLLALILGLLWRRLHGAGLRLWLLLAVMILLGDLLGNGLKHLLLQPRPCAELAGQVRLVTAPFKVGCSLKPHGMPSNHAVNFFVTALFLGGMLRSWRWGLALGAIATVVGLSRIYLGVHYPSQVLAGAGLGLLVAGLGLLLVGRTPPLRRWLALPPHGAEKT